MAMNFLGGVLLGAGLLTLVVGVRFTIAYFRADDNPFRMAIDRTGRWAFGIAGAVTGIVGMGFVEFAQVVEALVGFVGMHPYFASNFAIGGLGAGALAGAVNLSTGQYIGVALAILGLVLLVVEVDD